MCNLKNDLEQVDLCCVCDLSYSKILDLFEKRVQELKSCFELGIDYESDEIISKIDHILGDF